MSCVEKKVKCQWRACRQDVVVKIASES